MGQTAKKKMKTGRAKKKKCLTRKVLATNGICCLWNPYTNINDVCSWCFRGNRAAQHHGTPNVLTGRQHAEKYYFLLNVCINTWQLFKTDKLFQSQKFLMHSN